MLSLRKSSHLSPTSPEEPSQPNKTMLLHQQDNHMELITTETLEKSIDELDILIQKLSLQGIEIIFFEPHTHPSIANSPRSNQVRQHLLVKFPADTYHWIKPSEDYNLEDYKTSDGIHLSKKSAMDFANFIINHNIIK
jgi:hypothetical protein